ncbi:O-methyltransferase [Parafrankia sp. EUN1f]|uniref:O-methyltransferase n=1 Tax=Parafrankia sp. EUN1f TaxID=102897 RepID=UPI0001C45717|nr:O-methyltransferase [Parafrankia sp. EUN1f]EFC78758.1 O-methyltransferase family 3 [Parafrankia sp. EUN1f]
MTSRSDAPPAGGHSFHGKSGFLPPQLYRYLVTHGSPTDDILADLTAETAALGGAAGMQIPADQGALLTILTAAIAPSRAIEIGTFTGYSSLCVARALPPGGRLLCLDVSDEWTSIARRYWERAGVSDRVELRLGPAAESLAQLPARPTFDLAFIDADKEAYQTYLELLLPRLNPNGLIIVDNVLQSGRVLAEDGAGTEASPNVVAMRAFNEALARDRRVQVVMLPVADGLTLARKLP